MTLEQRIKGMTLLQGIKEHEGFDGLPYIDPIVEVENDFKDKYNSSRDDLNLTIGYGTLLPLTEKEAEMLLQHRLALMIMELHANKPEVIRMPQSVQDALGEMAYQLGVPSLLRFVKMWEALKNKDYELASKEALDSRWAKQTPNRANKIANIIRTGS